MARSRHRRTFAYTRRPRRARKSVAPARAAMKDEIVLFDHGEREFPVAIVRPREPKARLAALVGALRQWASERWAWLRPRTVPVIVAALGAAFILISADYLARDHAHAHAVLTVHITR
jgi:hypothetical protein